MKNTIEQYTKNTSNQSIHRKRDFHITENIISSSGEKESNISSIKKGLSFEFRESIKNMKNPYAKRGAGGKIVRILADLPSTEKLLRKQFIFNRGDYEKN